MKRLESLHATGAGSGVVDRIALAVPAPGSGLRAYRSIGRILVASDAACLILALAASYLARFGPQALDAGYVILALVAPVVWVTIFSGLGLYSVQRLTPIDEFRRVVSAVSVGMVVVIMTSYWSYAAISRIWVASTWALSMILVLTGRRIVRRVVKSRQAQGRLALRTVVVGRGEEAATLAFELNAAEAGFVPVGAVEVGERRGSGHRPPALGVNDLVASITGTGADCLFVASSAIGDDLMLEIVRAARRCGVEVYVSAALPEILSGRLSPQPLGRLMALSLKPVRLSGLQAATKRAFDLGATALVLLLAAPLMAVIAVLVRATSTGPILYRQERVTKGGRIFHMLKFRTMVTHGEGLLPASGMDPSVPFFKLHLDPRLTSVGRLLRRLSLDELPQLLNVLRGEMSLVGPRPLPLDQVLAGPESLGARHEVPAGITGWWQIKGRSDVSPDEAVRLDLFYIENWSLALDVYILAKTAAAVVARRGAY